MGSSCSTMKRKIKKRTKKIRHNVHLHPKHQISFINKAKGFNWFYGGEQQFFIVKIGKKKRAQRYYRENKNSLTPLPIANKKFIIGKRHMRGVASELIKNANNTPHYFDLEKYQQLSRWYLFLIFLRCGLHLFGDFYSILRPCRFSYSIITPEDSNGSDLEWRIIHSGVNLRQDIVSKHYMLSQGKSVLLSGEMFIYFEKECVSKVQQLIKTNKNIDINTDDELYSILPYCRLILDNDSGTYQPTNKQKRFFHIEQLLKNFFIDDSNNNNNNNNNNSDSDSSSSSSSSSNSSSRRDNNINNNNNISNNNNNNIDQIKFRQIKLEILDRTSDELKQYKTDMQINFNAIL